MEKNLSSKTNANRSLLDLTNSHIMSSVYSGVEMTTETTQGYREIVWPSLTVWNAGVEVVPTIPSSVKWPLFSAQSHNTWPTAPLFFPMFSVDLVSVAFLNHFETQSSHVTIITPLGPPAAILLSRTNFP